MVMLPRKLFVIWFYLLLVSVLILSLLPIEHPDVSPNDKVNHLIAYGTLMIFGILAHQRFLAVAIGIVCFGIIIEILQGQTGYRWMSYADMVANSIGVLISCIVLWLYKKLEFKSFIKD